MKIYYNPSLKEKARQLRKNSTLAEVLLWTKLKQRQIMGYQFMRQKPIDEYIVDFFCSKLKLIIEIDGDSHVHKRNYDSERKNKLELLGLIFLKFSDNQVKTNINDVLRTIENWILSQN